MSRKKQGQFPAGHFGAVPARFDNVSSMLIFSTNYDEPSDFALVCWQG